MRYGPTKKSFTRSLRFRLMIWNAAVVLMTGCVTLVALREGVRITLLRELDQLLREDLREIEIALSEHEAPLDLHEQLDRKAAGHAQHQWFAELIGSDGSVHYQSVHAPPPAGLAGNAWTADGRYRGRVAVVCANSREYWHDDSGRRLVALDSSGHRPPRSFRGLGRRWCAGGRAIVWVLVGGSRRLGPWRTSSPRPRVSRPSRLNERLEIRGTGDELDQLSQKFNRLLDRIGNYLQERRDFLANSAHELRTPLAAIRNSIEVALAGRRSREEYEELLTEILEESECLQVLVNQLLLLSETETERLKVDKQLVPLNQFVERAVDMFRAWPSHARSSSPARHCHQSKCKATPSICVR